MTKKDTKWLMLRPRDLSIINLPIRLQVTTLVVWRKLKTSKPIVSIYSLLQLLKEQKLFSTFPLIKKIGKRWSLLVLITVLPISMHLKLLESTPTLVQSNNQYQPRLQVKTLFAQIQNAKVSWWDSERMKIASSFQERAEMTTRLELLSLHTRSLMYFL